MWYPPDHLAAITPLAIETRKKVWRIGVMWGLGHLSGMLLIGMLFILLKDQLPLEEVSAYSEQLVGAVLIGVGLWALFKIFYKGKTHQHPHIHGGDSPYIHVHEHEHGKDHLHHHHKHAKSLKQNLWSSYSIGVLHGLAGIAHFILLLPVLGFESKWQSALYIGGFALGTVAAMAVYTYVLGLIVSASKKKANPQLTQGIRVAGGLFAIVIGVYWLYLGF